MIRVNMVILVNLVILVNPVNLGILVILVNLVNLVILVNLVSLTNLVFLDLRTFVRFFVVEICPFLGLKSDFQYLFFFSRKLDLT